MTVNLTVEKQEFDSAGQPGYRFSLHRERKEEQSCEEPDQDRQRHEETTPAPECLLLLAASPPPAVGRWRLLRRLGPWYRRVDQPPARCSCPEVRGYLFIDLIKILKSISLQMSTLPLI